MLKKCLPALLFFASTLATLGALEVALRLYFSANTNYNIEMWKYSQALKSSVMDERSHTHIPEKSKRLMNVDISTNSLGFRASELKSHGKRILALGDSLTLGWGVPQAETFVARLENALQEKEPRTQFLNLGIGNSNLTQLRAKFEIEGQSLNPDGVVYFWYINDAEATQIEKPESLLGKSILTAFLAHSFHNLAQSLHLKKDFREVYNNHYQLESWQAFKKELQKLQFAAGPGKLKVILLPDFRDLKNYPFIEIHRQVRELCTDLGIPHLDLLSAFQDKDSSELWVSADDPHPNSKAHEMIAKEVQGFIMGDL